MNWFRILAVILVFAVLPVMMVGCTGPKSVFHDKNLEAAIRDALGKPVGTEMTTAELANLTSLSVNSKAITDLTGLEHCVNLKGLTLNFNNVSDISALAGLSNLERLYLESNNISDISALADLSDLQRVSLENNDISDISPLADLGNLETLWLAGNNISDISALIEYTGLSIGDIVYFDDNPLSEESINVFISQLVTRGVIVSY